VTMTFINSNKYGHKIVYLLLPQKLSILNILNTKFQYSASVFSPVHDSTSKV
jgi:hypothetical protein